MQIKTSCLPRKSAFETIIRDWTPSSDISGFNLTTEQGLYCTFAFGFILFVSFPRPQVFRWLIMAQFFRRGGGSFFSPKCVRPCLRFCVIFLLCNQLKVIYTMRTYLHKLKMKVNIYCHATPSVFNPSYIRIYLLFPTFIFSLGSLPSTVSSETPRSLISFFLLFFFSKSLTSLFLYYTSNTGSFLITKVKQCLLNFK